MDQLDLDIEGDRDLKPAEFVKLVIDKFLKREGVFSEFRNIEDYVPEKSTPKQQALFLFYVVQLDYAVRGRVLYPGARNLYDQNPDFYTPDFIQGLEDTELLMLLANNLKPRYPNEAVLRYKLNSKKIKEEYGGDPLKIFTDSSLAEEVMSRIHSFRGMGPKTGNLFFRSVDLFFNLDYPDIENVLLPVDIHDVRIAYFLNFVESDEMTGKNINTVKQIWSNAARDAGVKWMVFDRALWLLGSEGKPKNRQDIISLLK
jgi:hypothetical protein